jgi:hypothetical protein
VRVKRDGHRGGHTGRKAVGRGPSVYNGRNQQTSARHLPSFPFFFPERLSSSEARLPERDREPIPHDTERRALFREMSSCSSLSPVMARSARRGEHRSGGGRFRAEIEMDRGIALPRRALLLNSSSSWLLTPVRSLLLCFFRARARRCLYVSSDPFLRSPPLLRLLCSAFSPSFLSSGRLLLVAPFFLRQFKDRSVSCSTRLCFRSA